MTNPSLTATILRFKAESSILMANQCEAEERGEEFDARVTFWPIIRELERWNRPAESISEAILALEFAIEDYECGSTDRIPSMMKAVLGWFRAEGRRMCERILDGGESVSEANALPRQEAPAVPPAMHAALVETLQEVSDRLNAIFVLADSIGDAPLRRSVQRVVEDAERDIDENRRVLQDAD